MWESQVTDSVALVAAKRSKKSIQSLFFTSSYPHTSRSLIINFKLLSLLLLLGCFSFSITYPQSLELIKLPQNGSHLCQAELMDTEITV